jgi:hypothetical protein
MCLYSKTFQQDSTAPLGRQLKKFLISLYLFAHKNVFHISTLRISNTVC